MLDFHEAKWRYGFDQDDIIRVLGTEDGEWFNAGHPIQINSQKDAWDRLFFVLKRLEESYKKGYIKPIIKDTPDYLQAPMVISDDLGSDVLNPADGNYYNSKSAYYRAVKDMGLEIMGNDAPVVRGTPKLKDIDWQNAVGETLKQKRGS